MRTEGRKKTAETSTEQLVSIDQIAELFKSASEELAEVKSKVDEYKARLVDYAEKHSEEWKDNALTFDNGVRVISKESQKADFDEGAIDIDWLDDFISASANGDLVKIKFDDKKLAKIRQSNKDVANLLDEIGYTLTTSSSLAVLTK